MDGKALEWFASYLADRKLYDIVSKHLPSVHCYADDTQLYLAFSPDVQGEDEAAINAMRDCIHDLRKWRTD